MHATHLPYWLATLYLQEIGPRRIMRWLDHFADIEKLFTASNDELTAIGLTAKQIATLQHPNWKAVAQDLNWAEQDAQHIITLTDEHYPLLLKEISYPPLVLFIKGNKTALSSAQMAIVGSRHATQAGLKNAKEFAAHLAERGLVITSGLALGVDGASHRGALSVGGVTIGVAGTGLHHVYPSSHASLVTDILSENGAIVSEFPLAVTPHPKNFPRRNRIIGGLSMGVLVVEAALKSGSLITARHALEQGREVFAIPGSIHHPLSRGCHALIRQGAKLVETAADIMEELGSLLATIAKIPKKKEAPGDLPQDLMPECWQLLEQIGCEITPIDVVLLRSRLTMGEVSSILLTLELNGYIQSVPGGYIRIVDFQ